MFQQLRRLVAEARERYQDLKSGVPATSDVLRRLESLPPVIRPATAATVHAPQVPAVATVAIAAVVATSIASRPRPCYTGRDTEAAVPPPPRQTSHSDRRDRDRDHRDRDGLGLSSTRPCYRPRLRLHVS